eukprot:6193250-Pleurochrysis_carterae.AAC.1
MCEISYGKRSTAAAASTNTADSPAPQPASQRGGSRRRRIGPSMGFRASAAAETTEEGNEPSELDELMCLEGADEAVDCDAMREFLKERFGNKAANVLNVLKLWEAFGKVYAAACDPWFDDTA